MKIDLNGKWTLSNDRKNINCPATVPGCVHTDLLANNIIEDPFWRVNEFQLRWILYENWTYTREFQVNDDFLDFSAIRLECMGLDTLASVWVNDILVAKTMSFYRRHSIDIKNALKKGNNTIKIEFTGPSSYAEPLAHSGTGAGPIHHTLYGSERMRKSLYQWGWDWGPGIPTSGIWRNIFIKGYNECKVEDFRISRDNNTLDFEVKTDTFSGTKPEFDIEIKDPDGKVLSALHGKEGEKLSYTVENPKLWWPNGYGDQPLYTITLKTKDETIVKKYGIRNVEWVEDKDKWGKTFYLRVNGKPVFLKGANQIPFDLFPTRITKEHREKLLSYCIEANMNCLRMWGGGYYECDEFYNFCDEHGILLWHDFMFGNSHYPMDDENLIREYAEEPKDNIRRLRHHPSIIIWAGNNEIEQCYNNGWPYPQNDVLKKEYEELFVNIIGKIAKEEDPERKYVRSSAQSEEIFSDPNLESDGDSHYWKVWGGPTYPYEEYREHTPRLLTEFGFQGLPSMETIKTFTRPEERELFSQTMEAHQKSGNQNNTVKHYVDMYFKAPKDFRQMIYLSQINQGNAIKCAVEHNKRNMNEFHCMGTLYWQLGDCWPGITWASLEYDGRWKALHYMAKEFYRPVNVSLLKNKKFADIYISNDGPDDFKGTVKYKVCKFDGTVVKEGEIDTEIKATSSKLVYSFEIEDNYTKELFLSAQLDDFAEQFVFFDSAKELNIPKPDVTVKAKGNTLSVSTDIPAFYAQIDVPDTHVRLDKNFVLLMPGKEYTFEIKDNDGMTAEEIAEKSVVLTLE